MVRSIALLGSTGSIGRQTLEVVRAMHGQVEVHALVANSNAELLAAQVREFRPKLAVCVDQAACEALRGLVAGLPTEIAGGDEGMDRAATLDSVSLVVSAVVGFAGLRPALLALRSGRALALANKETLVAGGALVMEAAAATGAMLLPVDSEHSAIFQCLQGQAAGSLNRVILTASGGPFRGWAPSALHGVTPELALRHPNWCMGPKVTIDSASLMNKGLEVIEAHWLFRIDYTKIEVVIHPESIVHSMVELIDGSILAQLGPPDMRLPIQYALTYPERSCAVRHSLSLSEVGNLTFASPDTAAFPCLRLAYEAGRAGGAFPAVLNAANEVAVDAFLRRTIGFIDIPAVVEGVLACADGLTCASFEELFEANEWARRKAYEIMATRSA